MDLSEDLISSAIDSMKVLNRLVYMPFTTNMNCIIEEELFSDMWAGGLRFAVFKSDLNAVLSTITNGSQIVEKFFEVAVYRRISFANEDMDKIDKYNDGFINGSRTSDNTSYLMVLYNEIMLGKRHSLKSMHKIEMTN